MPSSALAALLVGRPLRLAEEAVDVAKLDAALGEAKDAVDEAIHAEMLRGTLAWANGAPLTLKVTDAMLEPLDELTALGREEAWQELERAGYTLPARSFAAPKIEEFPDDRDPAAYLARNLGAIKIRIEQDLVQADLSGLAADAVARALLRVPGGRDIASRIVSTALVNGLAQTFEEIADDVGGWEYSAVLDGGVCDRCQPLDGTRYESWEAIQVVLPNGGPNPRCLGGGRCRCRAVLLPAGETV